jgi:hydroxymethylbilane synthase
MSEKRILLGTRRSKLALAQAHAMADALRQHYPDLTVELREIVTKGDRILDVALSAVGDKGLFVKEIEVALAHGEIDFAVHSGKDLPSVTPEGLTLVAFPRRVDPRDVIIMPQWGSSSESSEPSDGNETHLTSLDVLPQGATIGTSSLRRASQLRAQRPDLHLLDVRGNVDTRLSKLDSGQYDALVLACAGLERLGLRHRATYPLSPDIMLPAVAQGALIIEARADDTHTLELLRALNDPDTHTAVLAERAFLHRLEGGCQVPIAAHAQVEDGKTVHLQGLVGSLDGSTVIRGTRSGSVSEAAQVGTALAEEILERGAAPILAEIQAAARASGAPTP